MPNTHQFKLPMTSGNFVEIYTDKKGKRFAHFIINVEKREDTSDFRTIEPCGMHVELKKLKKRFCKDGGIYNLMSEFKQNINDGPLTQKEFDEEIEKANGLSTVFHLIGGGLPDGYYFIFEDSCGPKNKTEAREIRAFGVSASLSLKKLYELDQSFTLADVRMLEWLFAIRDCGAWEDKLDDFEIDDREDREWLFGLILSLEEMYRGYSKEGLRLFCCSREGFANAISSTMALKGLDLTDIENDPMPVYRYLEFFK